MSDLCQSHLIMIHKSWPLEAQSRKILIYTIMHHNGMDINLPYVCKSYMYNILILFLHCCWLVQCILHILVWFYTHYLLFSAAFVLYCTVYARWNYYTHSGSVSFIDQTRSRGSRLNIIIVAEGALDRHGKAITSSYVKDVSIRTSHQWKPKAWTTGVE